MNNRNYNIWIGQVKRARGNWTVWGSKTTSIATVAGIFTALGENVSQYDFELRDHTTQRGDVRTRVWIRTKSSTTTPTSPQPSDTTWELTLTVHKTGNCTISDPLLGITITAPTIADGILDYADRIMPKPITTAHDVLEAVAMSTSKGTNP